MFKKFFVLFTIIQLAGCAKTVPYDKLQTVNDPLQGFNRWMFGINAVFDRALFRPVAVVYTKIMPDSIEKGLHNVVTNAYEPFNMVNLILQGRISDAHISWARFFANTTVGVFGIWDPATKWGAPRFDEDFGQTLAVWGVGNGPYVVLPFIGASNLRDTVGVITHIFTPLSPTQNWRTEYDILYYAVNLFDTRVGLLGVDQMLYNQVDPYAFMKTLYTQNRAKSIYDNKELPQEKEEDLLDFLDK